MAVASPSANAGTTRLINAPREALYRAFTDPDALVVWQVPGEMTGKVHAFDARVGGGYRMSLFYPASEGEARGKTAAREDRYTARFVELAPPSRIVEAIAFDTTDPAFAGEMVMTVTLAERGGGTEVTIAFDNIPPGIGPEDNDAGTRSSLAKLARYVEGRGWG
ncbi:MAG TPA: SRPBCC family protein [Thermomicrobiales bacterium]|nr:SRPBCC family protein [Thermomicrobiales bacterium]